MSTTVQIPSPHNRNLLIMIGVAVLIALIDRILPGFAEVVRLLLMALL